MNNYRNNMPHYDSLPKDYNPMGFNEGRNSNDKGLHFTNSSPTMPRMPVNMFQTPFIPDTDMPFELDGNTPALPRMPEMPGLTQPGMMPGMPGLVPPWIMPEMQPGMPMMPDMPQMPMMPGMPQMPLMPGTPQTQMPTMPEMPQTQMPTMPGMPQTQMPMMPGMPPTDGNIYPMMPEMQMPGMPFISCEQLRELMRRMNCPVNGTLAPSENGTAPSMDDDM